VAIGKGRTHDFRIYKENPIYIGKKIELLADKGYQGIRKIHENSRTPIKKVRGKSLSKDQKKLNRQLAKERITVEHVHRKLNVFSILSSRYRNRRRRFGLRINLIAGIYNYELSLSLDLAIA
jgi:IS5 family transposase